MEKRVTYSEFQRVIAQRNGLAVACGLAVLMLVPLAWSVPFKEVETVIVPSVVDREMRVSRSRVSQEYLEDITRDVAVAVLNQSPGATDYMMSVVLRHAHPDAYGPLRSKLVEQQAEVNRTQVSVSCRILDIFPDARNLVSEVVCDMATFVGETRVNRGRKRWRFQWELLGRRLVFTEFRDITDEKRK